MGNICGKQESDAFSQPGRVLGSAPPPAPKTAPVPKKVGGPPRTLGGGSSTGDGSDLVDARRKAAEAAEVRITLTYLPAECVTIHGVILTLNP
jgi:hypothetical protein